MVIEKLSDGNIVKSIVTHGNIYKFVSDDKSPSAEEFYPDMDALTWVSPVEDGYVLGVFMIHPINGYTCEIHTCLLPEGRGKKAKDAAILVLDWIANNTDFIKVVTNVPSYNVAAKRLAEYAGMTLEGINRDSFVKNGRVYSQFVFGITKGEILCQQQP
jgi:RimJ/RimL family protein N-acetyltransferase